MTCECGRRAYRRGLCKACYRLVVRRPHRTNSDVVEDVEFMLETGETHPDAITARLGYTHRAGLYIALRRAGRRDLIKQLSTQDREDSPWASGS